MVAKVLLIEDDHGFSQVRSMALLRELPELELVTMDSEQSAETLLAEWVAGITVPPDLILLDGQLRWSRSQAIQPGHDRLFAGVRLIAKIRTWNTDLPIIAYSGDPRAFQGINPDANVRVLEKSDLAPTVEAIRSMLSAAGHTLRRPRRAEWWGESSLRRLSALIAGAVVVVGAVTGLVTFGSHLLHRHGGKTSHDFVLEPKTSPTVSIFGDPRVPSPLRFAVAGEQVAVKCRLVVNGTPWVELTQDDGWIKASDVRPAIDESTAVDKLPLC